MSFANAWFVEFEQVNFYLWKFDVWSLKLFDCFILIYCDCVKGVVTSFIRYLFNDTHMEELDSVQKFIEIQGWLLLTFFICLHNQLSSFNSIIVQMSEKRDSSNRQ